jgi:hypothetical protein
MEGTGSLSLAASDIHRGEGVTLCNLTEQLDCINGPLP